MKTLGHIYNKAIETLGMYLIGSTFETKPWSRRLPNLLGALQNNIADKKKSPPKRLVLLRGTGNMLPSTLYEAAWGVCYMAVVATLYVGIRIKKLK